MITFSHTHFVYIKILENIFFRPEEAMFENWQKLVSSYKIDLVQEKITFYILYLYFVSVSYLCMSKNI